MKLVRIGHYLPQGTIQLRLKSEVFPIKRWSIGGLPDRCVQVNNSWFDHLFPSDWRGFSVHVTGVV